MKRRFSRIVADQIRVQNLSRSNAGIVASDMSLVDFVPACREASRLLPLNCDELPVVCRGGLNWD
jgi:hypothetical protein